MIPIEFSEKDIKELDYKQFHHPQPRVQKKMEALYLKASTAQQGRSPGQD